MAPPKNCYPSIVALILATAGPSAIAAEPSPAPSAAPLAPSPDSNSPAPGRTFVELSGDDPSARLLRLDLRAGSPVEICQVPCSRWIDRNGRYQITAASVGLTRIFELPVGQPHVTLDVHGSSRAAVYSGLALIVVGLSGAVVGAFTMIGEGIDVQDSAERARDERPGLVLTGASLAAAIVGALLIVTSRSGVDSNTDLSF
jgi:hypothetical protein